MSDCWKAYDCLSDEGYQHETVNHSKTFVYKTTGAHTNAIESSWRHAKVALPAYRRHKEFFAGYLAKYMFMKHVRYSRDDPTVVFLRAAGVFYNPRTGDDDAAIGGDEEQMDGGDNESDADEAHGDPTFVDDDEAPILPDVTY